jgi:DNA-binding GntR family transcriptional regulator
MTPTAESRGKITYVSLTDECYNRIRSDILNDILPWGEQLDVARIADEFGVSRSPVVKAVERLAHEGLVEIRPNKGSYVRTPTVRDIDEVTEIRNAVERLACELAYTKHHAQLMAMLDENEQRLSAYEAQPETIPFGVFLEYDREFHLIFARLADNQRLLDIFEIIRNQVELFRTRTYLGPQTQRALHWHREVIAHLRDRRLPEALSALQDHIEEVRLDTLSSLA